jgi:hypothetical protein
MATYGAFVERGGVVPPRTPGRRPPIEVRPARATRADALRLLRRTHMYAGLFMLPWVTLYGLTGLFLNHPTAVKQGDVTRPIGSSERLLGSQNGPSIMATRLAGALATMPGVPGYRSDAMAPIPGTVHGVLDFVAIAHDTAWDVSWDLDQRAAVIRPHAGRNKAATRTFEVAPATVATSIDLDPARMATLAAAALSTSTDPRDSYTAVLSADSGRAAPAPRAHLTFTSVASDTVWRTDYDLASGKVQIEPQRLTQADARDVLTRLHKTRTYPDAMGLRWLWALFVDGAGLLMLFWAASGLLMWWQLRAVRRSGAIVLATSATVAVILLASLYRGLL